MRLRPCVMLLLHAAMCSIVHVLQQMIAVVGSSYSDGGAAYLHVSNDRSVVQMNIDNVVVLGVRFSLCTFLCTMKRPLLY